MTQNETDNRARWTALVVLCTGMLMIVLDATIVNVALPSIQDDLGFSQASLAWVVNAYLIAFGGLLLLAGRLGDLWSRRGMFLAGLALFTTASVACGAAQSQAMLVAARFLQGIGGAMTSAVILGMIVTMFPQPREQARAIGVFSFVASAGGSVGLLAGGLLTQSINWHWIFFVNIPIGIATAVFALRFVPADRGAGFGRGADVPGAVLITAAVMTLVFTIVNPAAEKGWGATETLAFGALAVVLAVAFVVREATAANPLIPLRIFRSREMAGANLIQAFLVASMFATFFMGSLYLERVLHYDPLEIGLAFLPLTLVMGGISLRYAEWLITRIGPHRLLIPGLGLMVVALLLFARAPVHAHYAVDVLPVMLLLGVGIAVAGPALMTLAMAGASPEDTGLASGLINTTTQVGGALGLAVLATVAGSRTAGLRDAGKSAAQALTSGYHLAYLIAAVLALVGLGLAAYLLRTREELAAPAAPDAVADGLCAEAA